MSTKRITAIMPTDLLPSLESHLRACGVPGVTVEHVQGYGEHPNFFRRDLMNENVRVVLYADADDADGYVDAIRRCALQSEAKNGVLAVETIDRLVRFAEPLTDDNRNGGP